MRAALFDRLLDLCSLEEGGSCTSPYFMGLDQLMGWLQLENRASLPEMAQYVVKFFTFLLQSGVTQADYHVR